MKSFKRAVWFPQLSSQQLSPILKSHGWSNLSPINVSENKFEYPMATRCGALVTVCVKIEGSKLMLSFDRVLQAAEEKFVVKLCERILSTDFPLHQFVDLCRAKNEPTLLKLAQAGWGRMLRSPTTWEDAAKTLFTTNASWGYTQKMCEKMCSLLGGATPSGKNAFPSPKSVLFAGEKTLLSKVGIGYRTKSLLLLAEKALSGDAPWLLDPSCIIAPAEAEKEIASWHGFGTYATRHLLVLMGFHNYLPIDREVGNYLGIRKPGFKQRKLDTTKYDDWGAFRYTAYKLTRVARLQNWIGD